MSQFPNAFSALGPFSYGTGIGQSIVVDNQNPTGDGKPAKHLPPTDRAMTWYGGIGGFPSVGGPGMFPSFTNAPWSSPWLYWEMRKYATVVLAYSVTTSSIIAGTRHIKVHNARGQEKLAEKMRGEAENDLIPVLAKIMPGALECLNFGNWLHELVWDRREGRTTPCDANSILPTEAVLHCNKQRHFTGYDVAGQFRDARYGFLAVNQPHVHPTLGYSRLEGVKQDWWRAIQSNLNADRVERKAAGIQMVIAAPIGASFIDDKGNALTSKQWMTELMNAAVNGDSFMVPKTPFRMSDIIEKPELWKLDAVTVQPIDWGNPGPALEAHLARLEMCNRNIMRGYQRPERESTEGTHGTKAEAGVHGAIGTLDSELVHSQICRQFDEQVLSLWRLTNYGPDSPELMTMPQPLADPQQSFLQQIVTTLLSDRMTGPDFALNLDPRALLERTDAPLRSKSDVEEALSIQEAVDGNPVTDSKGAVVPPARNGPQKQLPAPKAKIAASADAMPLWKRGMIDKIEQMV